MKKPQWYVRYNCYSLTINRFFKVTINWENGQYESYVNGVRMKQPKVNNSIEDYKKYILKCAKEVANVTNENLKEMGV